MCNYDSYALPIGSISQPNNKKRSSLKQTNLNESNSLEKRIAPTNKVRFADTEKIFYVEARSEISKQEANNFWYTNDDYSYFRIDNHIVTSPYRQEDANKYLIKAYKAAEKGNVDSSLSIFLKWMDAVGPNATCRGLENMCNYDYNEKKNNDQRKAIRAVLTSQEISSGNDKDAIAEYIRNASENATLASRKFSFVLGTIDAIQVNGNIRPKSRSFVKRLSGIIRSKKTVIPVSC